jgi:Flp pilus assembly protein TadD
MSETAQTILVSYNRAEWDWGQWIAWEVEAAGHRAIFDVWDFRPGQNFVTAMQQAVAGSDRTIAVFSPHYLSARFTAPEWAAAFAQDPTGALGTLVPVRVAPCDPRGLLPQLVYIDFVDADEATARRRLRDGLKLGRLKPGEAPRFPGGGVIPAREKPAFPGAPAVYWNVRERNPFFTGRDEVLGALHTTLQHGRRVALTGLGGLGKTQTAVEFAHRHRDAYRAVFWASAASPETLISGFVALARLLNLPQQDETDQGLTVEAVRRWLRDHSGWLLILDNANDLAPARDLLPSIGDGSLLLTTRATAIRPVAPAVVLTKMAPEVGARLLLRRAGRLADDAPIDRAEPGDRAAALALSRELDGLPLALDQAGAFIEEMTSSPAEYLDLFRTERDALLRRRGGLGGRDHDHASVTTTFSLAFAQVEHDHPAAADLLRLCAVLDPDAIPEEVLTAGAPHLGERLGPAAADKLALTTTIGAACRFSLLSRDTAARTLTLHRLVQAVLQDEMDEATRRTWAERAVRAVARAFPSAAEFSNWPTCNQLLPQGLACVTNVEKYELKFPEAGFLLNQVGGYLDERGQYNEAEPLYRGALAIREQALGPEHPDTATSLNNLAALLNTQGKLSEAEPLFRRALAIREQALGPEHPHTATSLNNLAALLDTQGKLSEAEPLYRRALAITEQALGPEHPDTARSLNNLAFLYQAEGKLSEAEPLYRHALAILESVLGPEHPTTVTVRGNLAALHQQSHGPRRSRLSRFLRWMRGGNRDVAPGP